MELDRLGSEPAGSRVIVSVLRNLSHVVDDTSISRKALLNTMSIQPVEKKQERWAPMEWGDLPPSSTPGARSSREGTQTSLEYPRMLDRSTRPDERKRIREDLLICRGHDTLAMVRIREEPLKRFWKKPLAIHISSLYDVYY
jgi:hypothetical protein